MVVEFRGVSQRNKIYFPSPGQVLVFVRSLVAQLWPRFVAFPTRKLYAEQFVKASLQHVADTELVTVVEGGRNGWTVDWWIGQ